MTDAGTPARLILGIETSCDETAAAVVDTGLKVRSNVIASQHELHAEYRGVVPEIASRAHAERILPIIEQAVREAGVSMRDIDAIAVTSRPGLVGSLLVGVAAGKAMAWSLGVPVIGVDHIHAHLHACALDRDAPPRNAIGLVVSGGHTALYRCEWPLSFERIGSTIDDAIGEAYDKVATILGLGYPGGPIVDRLARDGDERAFEFPISRLGRDSLDFSFSGLKTAVLYTVEGVPTRRGDRRPPAKEGIDRADSTAIANVAASFQRAAVRAVRIKVERALDAHPDAAALLVGGGVSANSRLRADLTSLCEERRIEIRLPRMDLCLDNAAMVAGVGAHALEAREWASDALDLSATPTGSVTP